MVIVPVAVAIKTSIPLLAADINVIMLLVNPLCNRLFNLCRVLVLNAGIWAVSIPMLLILRIPVTILFTLSRVSPPPTDLPLVVSVPPLVSRRVIPLLILPLPVPSAVVRAVTCRLSVRQQLSIFRLASVLTWCILVVMLVLSISPNRATVLARDMRALLYSLPEQLFTDIM